MIDAQQFTALQRALHWLMALLILSTIFIGVDMVSTIAPKYFPLMATHMTLGVAILILALIRLGVRWRYGAPALPTDTPTPMKLAAKLSHNLLYGLMIVMPLLGWTMLSTADSPVVLLGGVRLPQILPQSERLQPLLWDVHHYLAFLFFVVILLHVSAALFHALIRRDGVFAAMSPLRTRKQN